MVKQNSSKKSKQSHKTNHKSEHTDKNKPTVGKRQPSGYLMFCAEQREIRKNDFEKMKPKEIMQNLGAEWRKLSIQQKESYKTKAPIKANHDVCTKEELKSQKSQQPHAKSASSYHYSGIKTKSNTTHKTSTKSASKKKTNTKKIKHTHEKSTSRKLAHHHEDNHENDVNSSQ